MVRQRRKMMISTLSYPVRSICTKNKSKADPLQIMHLSCTSLEMWTRRLLFSSNALLYTDFCFPWKLQSNMLLVCWSNLATFISVTCSALLLSLSALLPSLLWFWQLSLSLSLPSPRQVYRNSYGFEMENGNAELTSAMKARKRLQFDV